MCTNPNSNLVASEFDQPKYNSMEDSASTISGESMPYLEQLHGYRRYALLRDIYLTRHNCEDVLNKPQIVPPEAPNNANAETKALAAERRKEYFKMQGKAFGIIAMTLSRCGNLMEDIYNADPTLRPGSGERTSGSKLIDAVEKYVLQNKSSGLYATYTQQLQSLRLNQFKNVEALITELNNLYTMTDQSIKANDGMKIAQLGVALGVDYHGWMRINAYTDGATYVNVCEMLRNQELNGTAVQNGAKATESELKKSAAKEESNSEAANYSSEEDFRDRKRSLSSRYSSRFEYKRSNPRSRSSSRAYSYTDRGRGRDRGRSRSNSRGSSRGSSRDSRGSRDSRDGRRHSGSDKRRVRWDHNGKPEREQRDRTNRDHFVNEVVQASKRQNIQCHSCKGFGHYKRECANNNR